MYGGGASSPLGLGEDKTLVCILENYKVCRRLHKRREGGWCDHLAAFNEVEGLRVCGGFVGCLRLRKEEGGWMVRLRGGYFVMEGF